MNDANIFALAQLIKAAGTDPGDVTTSVWSDGYRKPARGANEAVALTLDILAGFEGSDLPWDVWPKDYQSILRCELNEIIVEELWRSESSPASTAKAIIAAGYSTAGAKEKCRSNENEQVSGIGIEVR